MTPGSEMRPARSPKGQTRYGPGSSDLWFLLRLWRVLSHVRHSARVQTRHDPADARGRDADLPVCGHRPGLVDLRTGPAGEVAALGTCPTARWHIRRVRRLGVQSALALRGRPAAGRRDHTGNDRGAEVVLSRERPTRSYIQCAHTSPHRQSRTSAIGGRGTGRAVPTANPSDCVVILVFGGRALASPLLLAVWARA